MADTKSNTPSFIVQYCANCDGGDQERGAATEAILNAAPGAKVTAKRLDEYPIKVTVSTDDGTGRPGKTLWNGRQQALFRKNPADRAESQKEIAEAVKAAQA